MLSQREFLALLTLAYFGFAELLSEWMSQFPDCIIVSETQLAKDQSGHETCATLFEGIMRFSRFIWENVTHDHIIAFGTVAIAAFTFTLWRSTNKMWDASERQFRLARDEFLSTHRPKIRIKHVWLMSELWHENPIIVRVVCVNKGLTDAVITEYAVRFFLIDARRSLPPNPQWTVQISITAWRLVSA